MSMLQVECIERGYRPELDFDPRQGKGGAVHLGES
jgi:hypothetical protein